MRGPEPRICVVGASTAGLFAAWRLAAAGQPVVVYERSLLPRAFRFWGRLVASARSIKAGKLAVIEGTRTGLSMTMFLFGKGSPDS